jgi:hypothetical protein
MVDTSSIPPDPGPTLSKANIWNSIFGWKALFRWDALGAVVPGIIIATGLAMLGVDWFPYHLLLVQICFAIAGFLFVVKIIGHAIESKDTVHSRWIFGLVLCAICVGGDLWIISAIQFHKELIDLTPSLLPLPKPTPTALPAVPIGPVITPRVPPAVATVHGLNPQLPKTPTSAVSATQTSIPIMLSATIMNPLNPMIVVTNHSDQVAEDVTWAMILYRASDNVFFSYKTQTIGYIKANSISANYEMNLPGNLGISDGNEQIKAGDDLTGSLSVDCPHCQIQTYVVHFDWGQSGWLYESEIKAGYIVPKNPLSKEARAAYIQALKSKAIIKNSVIDIVNATPY